MKKVLLYSGGMDSWLIKQLWHPDVCLYIDIHGDYSSAERKRLPDDIIVLDFPLLGTFEMDNKFVPLRNLYFLMIASNYGDTLCLGATAGDGSNDKSLEFLCDTEIMLNKLWHDKKIHKDIKIEKKYVTMSKAEILTQYLREGHNISEVKNNTFSCYTPRNGNECMCCYPCFRKFAILYSFGYIYNEDEERKMWKYIQQNIIPTKEEGGYPGTYYTERGEESIHLIHCVEGLRDRYGK